MSRVCDQKEADAVTLRKTKDEIGKLSSKIDENAKYVQDIEVCKSFKYALFKY